MDLNAQELAYIGDAVYEMYIRKYLINKKIRKVNNLQKEAKKYVSAIGQSTYLKNMIDNDFLNEKEIDLVKNARNFKTASKPKNSDIITYKYATALEALIGYLYLSNKKDRIDEIMNYILEDMENVCIW
ncbi:MAG: Mini-ribonuclease 3 [Bacilli bacterium]|nr:Mini-ribonuclease 3 [Bacilli bacterium]